MKIEFDGVAGAELAKLALKTEQSPEQTVQQAVGLYAMITEAQDLGASVILRFPTHEEAVKLARGVPSSPVHQPRLRWDLIAIVTTSALLFVIFLLGIVGIVLGLRSVQ